MLALGILAPILVLAVASSFWRGQTGPPLWFVWTGATIFGVIGLSAGAYFWRFKATPLTAERSGRVAYGWRTLLEPGATRRLHLERIGDSEGPDRFAVVAENCWGPSVRIETPYLDTFGTPEAAYWFATRLGGVIGADVVPVAPDATADGGA
jgi:hypothetical protein